MLIPAVAHNAHQAGEGILFALAPACLCVYLSFAHTCSVVSHEMTFLILSTIHQPLVHVYV